MVKREYNGPPLDGTGGHDGNSAPPWANDGKTVDATSPEDTGEMSTEQFSLDDVRMNGEEWEPTPEQVANARRVLLSGEMSGTELAEAYGIGSGDLSRYVRGEGDVHTDEPGPIEFDQTEQEYVLSNSEQQDPRDEVREMRERALEGEAATEIAEDYDCHARTVQRRLRGDDFADVTSPPHLEFDRSEQQYVPKDAFKEEPDADALTGYELQAGEWNATPAEVAAARRLLLDSKMSATALAELLGASQPVLSFYLRGKKDIDPDDPPAIEYDQSAGEYVTKGDRDTAVESAEQETTGKDADDDQSIQVETTPVDQSGESGGTGSNRALIAFLAFVLGYLFSRLGGGSE